MFVEGVRLFVVVLGTAAGFWPASTSALGSEGLGGMLGCLLGYVAGGFFGRFLDRALGAVERQVETKSPAQFIAGTLGAIAGGAARPRARAPARVAHPGSRSPSRPRVSPHGCMGWLGFRVALPSEHRGARVARHVDAPARARARIRRA